MTRIDNPILKRKCHRTLTYDQAVYIQNYLKSEGIKIQRTCNMHAKKQTNTSIHTLHILIKTGFSLILQ